MLSLETSASDIHYGLILLFSEVYHWLYRQESHWRLLVKAGVENLRHCFTGTFFCPRFWHNSPTQRGYQGIPDTVVPTTVGTGESRAYCVHRHSESKHHVRQARL